MNNIKFRAWIGELSKFADSVCVYNDGSWFAESADIGGYSERGGGILMQYTGLKDKNGVEIYEGDIVKVFENGEFSHNHKVEFKEGCFPVDVKGVDYEITTMWWATDSHYYSYEVIGNIYENPELLGESNE